jgi:hypothetical protein
MSAFAIAGRDVVATIAKVSKNPVAIPTAAKAIIRILIPFGIDRSFSCRPIFGHPGVDQNNIQFEVAAE